MLEPKLARAVERRPVGEPRIEGVDLLGLAALVIEHLRAKPSVPLISAYPSQSAPTLRNQRLPFAISVYPSQFSASPSSHLEWHLK
jgi:hypothetical protein